MRKVFISYTWDNDKHKEWVVSLASKLEEDDIEVELDQWSLEPGDEMSLFMEKSIYNSNYILVICTKNYKEKTNSRIGGSGYEARLMSIEIIKGTKDKKVIPILRCDSWDEGMPDFLKGNLGVNLNYDFNDEKFIENYNDLLTTIYGAKRKRVVKKEIPVNKIAKHLNIKPEELEFNSTDKNFIREIKIEGIITDKVTIPKLDGTRGSALYSINFRLSDYPDNLWRELFIRNWNMPPTFTSMHRPGIAKIIGDEVVLNGTTIEEVQNYHRDTLKIVVKKTNEEYKSIKEREFRLKKIEEEKINSHYKNINDIASKIEFD